MKKSIFKFGLLGMAVLGLVLSTTNLAHAVPCTLLYVNPGGLTAVYDCGEHGLVTVVRPTTIR